MNILLSQHISQFDFYALLSSFLFRDRVVVFASHLWRLVSYWLCLPRAEMTGMCYYVHLSFLYLITCQLVFKIKYTTFKKVFLLKTEMMLIVFKNNVKIKFHFSSIYFYFQNCFAGFFCHVYSPGWFPNWIFSCFLKWQIWTVQATGLSSHQSLHCSHCAHSVRQVTWVFMKLNLTHPHSMSSIFPTNFLYILMYFLIISAEIH